MLCENRFIRNIHSPIGRNGSYGDEVNLNQITLKKFFFSLEYDVSQLSVELAEGRFTSLSVIISRVFQR